MADQEIELKKLTIVIAGRSFPVKVSKEEALILPQIEKELNDQIRQMQMAYLDKDVQDCLSMVLLTKAISAHNPASSITPDAESKVDKINKELESVLG